jgi:hypothetical protein
MHTSEAFDKHDKIEIGRQSKKSDGLDPVIILRKNYQCRWMLYLNLTPIGGKSSTKIFLKEILPIINEELNNVIIIVLYQIYT